MFLGDDMLLDGLVALDLCDLRGAFCGKCLRDLGMHVIKVERPEGDPVRRTGPFKGDLPHLEGSLRFSFLNAGKHSLTIDLSHPEGREIFLKLVEDVDVVIESYDPGDLGVLGLNPETLFHRNPRLVLTSLSGFGQSGPFRDYRAPDIVAFAMGGLMYIAGDPNRPPVNAPETQAHYYPSIYAALGTVTALWARETSGRGQHVDIAAQEALATQEHLIRLFGTLETNVRRHGSQHSYTAPANIFPTKDGYVFLFASRAHWPKLLKVWPNHPPEFDAVEWQSDTCRRSNMEFVNAAVSEFTLGFGKEEFAMLMQEHGIPCLPVNTPLEFANDEQLTERRAIQPVDHPYLGRFPQVATPLLVDGERFPPAAPPMLGEHTASVLSQRLGLSLTEVGLLHAHGIV